MYPQIRRIADGAAWYSSGRSRCLQQAAQPPVRMQCGCWGSRIRDYTGAAIVAVEERCPRCNRRGPGGEGPEAAEAGTMRDKRPQTHGRRGTRCRRRLDDGGGQAVRAVSAQQKSLHRRRSARHPMRADLDDATANAWEEKNKEYRSDQIHCGGGARSGPRGVREITPPPLMATSWAMTRRYRGLFTRIETE